MIKKQPVFFILFTITLGLFSCSESKYNRIATDLAGLSSENPEIAVLNWRLLGPFKDTTKIHDVLSLPTPMDTLVDFFQHENFIDTALHQQAGYFIDFESLYGTADTYNTYALSVISSKKKQDVAFLMGVDDNLRLWVNGKFVFGTTVGHVLNSKNQIIKRVSLEKGNNFIIAEIDNTGGGICRFKLDVSTIEHVRKNALINDYYNVLMNPVLDLNDSLHIKISDPDFIPITKPSTLKVYNINRDLVLKRELSLNKTGKIHLNGISEGLYSYVLNTDKDTFNGFFVHGKPNALYNKDSLLTTFEDSPFVLSLLEPYLHRMDRLLSDATIGMDNMLADKIARCLYKIKEISKVAAVDEKKAARLDGWQIRSFVSGIDGSNDHYLLYIPEANNNRANTKMPLVVMVPYVTSNHPFYTGAIVANSQRITYITQFAERYGFAVIWPSSRIYTRYNLTPIVGESIREAINNAGHYYNVDRQNLFYYGDCSGGLFALMAAINNPEGIKAIALEGPELSAMPNDFFALSKANLQGINMMILHSENDQTASLTQSIRLMKLLGQNGQSVVYDDLRSGMKRFLEKMYSESESMQKVFDYFSRQIRLEERKAKKEFSGHILVKDTVYGITVNNKHRAGTFSYNYEVRDNSLKLSTENVSEISLDLAKIGLTKPVSGYRIYVNNQPISALDWVSDGKNLEIKIPVNDSETISNHYELRFPINAVFSSPFILLADSSKYQQQALKQFESIWQREYLVKPKQVNIHDRSYESEEKNIVRFINDTTFSLLRDLATDIKVPNTLSSESISYAHVSELEKGHLQLTIGVNGNELSDGLLAYLITEGREGTIIWSNDLNRPVHQLFPE